MEMFINVKALAEASNIYMLQTGSITTNFNDLDIKIAGTQTAKNKIRNNTIFYSLNSDDISAYIDPQPDIADNTTYTLLISYSLVDSPDGPKGSIFCGARLGNNQRDLYKSICKSLGGEEIGLRGMFITFKIK
jgi:hypothetical protein